MSSSFDDMMRQLEGVAVPHVWAVDEQPSKNDVKKLKSSQYEFTGMGYNPVSATYPKLPAGVYKLGEVAKNQYGFIEHNMVTDDLIELADSKSLEVVKEIETFWTLKEEFKKYGFSHKRGLLLVGGPGGGKSSTISLVAKQMIKNDGIVLLVNHPNLMALVLPTFREIEPERKLLVVMEDLDAMIHRHGEEMILNILDGDLQIANVCFISTTNYPEKLDARLTNRPSRFDKVIVIQSPSKELRREFLRRKIGDNLVVEGIDLVEATDGLSFAHLRELVAGVFCYKNSVKETLDRLKDMKNTVTSDMFDKKSFGLMGI